MYESLGNKLLAEADGFGTEIAERIVAERSWPSQASVTIAHDFVEGLDCHLIKARLSTGEPVLRIESEGHKWGARLQDGWVFQGVLEGKKVVTRQPKTFLKKLEARNSAAFVKMVEETMVQLIEAHQEIVKPIHEAEVKRYGPYHLPMTEAFMGIDMPVLDEASWLDREVKNPKTGRWVKVKSLPAELRQKYNPNKKTMPSKPKKDEYDDDSNYSKIEPRRPYHGEDSELNEGVTPLERKILRHSKEGHHIQAGRMFGTLRKKGLVDDSGVLTKAGELEIAESAENKTDLTEGKKPDYEKAIVLMRNDRKHKDILIKLKNNSMKYFDSYYKRSDSDVRKGEEIEQSLNRKLEKREAELGLKRSKNGMMYAESAEISEFKAPVEIPFGAIADFQGKEYKKIQLTDKPMWRLVAKSGVRQKELGSDIAKGDKNYASIEKRAKMQLRSKKLFDPKRMPSDIKQKYRKLSIKLLKAPLAMKRKYQAQIDNLISGQQGKKSFTPLTDGVAESELSEGYSKKEKGLEANLERAGIKKPKVTVVRNDITVEVPRLWFNTQDTEKALDKMKYQMLGEPKKGKDLRTKETVMSFRIQSVRGSKSRGRNALKRDMGEADDSWLDRDVKNPETGRWVKVKSLPTELRQKYNPNKSKVTKPKKSEYDDDSNYSKIEPSKSSNDPSYWRK